MKGGVLMKKYLKLIEFSDKKSVWLLFFVHFIMAGFNVYVSFCFKKELLPQCPARFQKFLTHFV